MLSIWAGKIDRLISRTVHFTMKSSPQISVLYSPWSIIPRRDKRRIFHLPIRWWSSVLQAILSSDSDNIFSIFCIFFNVFKIFRLLQTPFRLLPISSRHKNLQIKIFFWNLFLVLFNFSYWCVLNQELENDPNSLFGHTRETQKTIFFAEVGDF